ncbi:unnamed protein product [Acanthosepion pharaonis]|uniref:CUB domain-containing protein n=1 Tax=Acanthosepion pharaonis TaxID=158019 RepID=A0A812DPX7_ACAPH|nr:unnamed protein product [Sepia pharaonis]
MGKLSWEKFLEESSYLKNCSWKSCILKRPPSNHKQLAQLKLLSELRDPPQNEKGNILPHKNYKIYPSKIIQPVPTRSSPLPIFVFILTNQDFYSCCGDLKMIKSRFLEWITRFWCFFILPCILSERILNMDELSTCGQKIEVFETPVIINARSSIPPTSRSPYCQVILETTSRDGAYRLQITIKSVAIKDSTFMLRIYDGQGALNLLRQIGTSSKSTDIIYTKSSFATIILTQSTNIKFSENDFTLEVKGYRDPDEDEPVVGGSKLSPGAIVGIILAILLLIGFATVLCYMYNTGIFTKKRSVSSQSVVGSKESLSKTPSSISSISSKKGYTENEFKDFHSAFLSSISMKVSGNHNHSRSDSGNNQRSSHPKMPPSRAEVKTISDKDVYEEPISTRRFGKTSSVTFDTRQQEPPYFQRSYAGGIQNGQRSPKSSLAKSKYGIPDRSSGHSNASYAEIKDLPDMMSNLKSQETSLRGSSQIQKEQRLPSAPRPETQNSYKKSYQSPRSSLHSSSRDTGNDLTSEDSSHLSIRKETAQKKQKAALLKEINTLNSDQKREFSNSDAAEKGKPCEKVQETEEGLSKSVPGQKSAVVKSGYDPSTGCQTTRVLWTDSIPDPTDPEPGVDNPCITRKTINRITTRSTYENLPENPFPLLNQIQMESNEPSFLSPSVVSQHNMLPSSEWVSEIPHSEEISFYTQSASSRTKVPIIHEANQKHHSIKDRITIT